MAQSPAKTKKNLVSTTPGRQRGRGSAREKPRARSLAPTDTGNNGAARAQSAICREPGCENLATTSGYCRAHYIKNWNRIKRKEVILKDGKFRQFIADLIRRYPDSVIRAIRHDLSSDEEFERVRQDIGLHTGVEDYADLGPDTFDDNELLHSISIDVEEPDKDTGEGS